MACFFSHKEADLHQVIKEIMTNLYDDIIIYYFLIFLTKYHNSLSVILLSLSVSIDNTLSNLTLIVCTYLITKVSILLTILNLSANGNNISSNEEELCDICILLVYSFHPNYKKDFAWDLFGDIIIKNIINNTDGIAHMPVKDNNGTVEYLYSKYGFIELDLKEPLEE